MKRRHELTDSQWDQIASHLPGKKGDPGRTGENNRRFVNAVIWLAKTGAPWRDLPERFGKWNSVFQRYNRWCKKGVWQRIFETSNPTWSICCWILPPSVRTNMRRPAKGESGAASFGKIAWWLGDQDSCRRECSGNPRSFGVDRW